LNQWEETMRRYVVRAAAAVAWLASFPAAAAQIAVYQHDGTVSVKLAAPPPGGRGWQSYYTYDVPTGENLSFTYQCPTSDPVVVNGAFNTNTAARAGFSLVANYRPSNDSSKWTWVMFWPSGAPSGSRVYFNIYCARS
jgi:hypothetical protein